MKRLIFLTLLLTSCSATAVQQDSNFVAVQQIPAPNVEAEKLESSNCYLPMKTNIPLPTPEKSNLTWEDIYFKSIIEREKILGMKSLRSIALRKEDLEIRVWNGFGITTLNGFVLKRTAGEWSAVDVGWEVADRKGKRNAKPLGNKLNEPKPGWDSVWQQLVDAGLLTLPDAEGINCSGNMNDGFSYVVEYKIKGAYRTYMYDNPEYAKCDEAKRMVLINKIIADEFFKTEVKING